MAEWKPIETAEKGDIPILVFAQRRGWEREKPRIVCVKWYKLARRWYIYGCAPTGLSEQWLDECEPTHWMHLPAPPESEGEN